jgi:hypothetical protein
MKPKRRYFWSEWFRYPKVMLVRGIHYHCTNDSFKQQMRNAATSREIKISIRDYGTHLLITQSTLASTLAPTDAALHCIMTPVSSCVSLPTLPNMTPGGGSLATSGSPSSL